MSGYHQVVFIFVWQQDWFYHMMLRIRSSIGCSATFPVDIAVKKYFSEMFYLSSLSVVERSQDFKLCISITITFQDATMMNLGECSLIVFRILFGMENKTATFKLRPVFHEYFPSIFFQY